MILPERRTLRLILRRGRKPVKPTQRNRSNAIFCTPHASQAHAARGTTPAMAAGMTDHAWTVQALLSFHVPPPRWTPPKQRGRPSHALKRLLERWCGDHGAMGSYPVQAGLPVGQRTGSVPRDPPEDNLAAGVGPTPPCLCIRHFSSRVGRWPYSRQTNDFRTQQCYTGILHGSHKGCRGGMSQGDRL